MKSQPKPAYVARPQAKDEDDPFRCFGGISVANARRLQSECGPYDFCPEEEKAAPAQRPGSAVPQPDAQGPLLQTDMRAGRTIFYKGDGTPPIVIETRNDTLPDSMPGANEPFRTPSIVGVEHRGDTAPYGKDGAYIKTGDNKGRDIHGGGRTLPDPTASRQPLTPTAGCTRGHNDDLVRLGEEIEEFQRLHPGVPIPYERK